MPNLNEYYQLLQKEEPLLSNDAMREMIASAMERVDKEALATPQATESVRRSRLNGTGIVIGSAAIIALTFWGFNYFQSQQSSTPQAPGGTALIDKCADGKNTVSEENTPQSDANGKQYASPTDGFLPSSCSDVPQTSLSVATTDKETEFPQNTFADVDESIRYSSEQNTSDSTMPTTSQAAKSYWQLGKAIHQKNYFLLGQLVQRALVQSDVKTTFSQLFAPCTLTSVLAGQSTNDCILALLEREAAQIQDSVLQSMAATAKKNKNFSNNTSAESIQSAKERVMHIKRSLTSAPDPNIPTGINNGMPSSLVGNDPYNLTTMKVVITDPSFPQKKQQRLNDIVTYGYRNYLLAAQNHIWKTNEKLDSSKESFQNQGIPAWFQGLIQQRRYDYARSIIDSILAHESGTAELYTLRGDMSKAMDSVAASIADYSQALSLQESSELYMLRGTQYFTGGKRQEAYNDFANAVRLEPKNYQAVYMRGAAAYNLKRFEEACDDWSLAAQMGHPLADSILAVKCTSMLPKYVRTAQTEQAQKMKTLALLLERVKQGIDNIQTSYIRSEQVHRFDSLSYKSLSSYCNISAVLMGSASMHCAIHSLYTFALDLHDIPLALLAKSMGQQPSNSLSPLLSQSSSNSNNSFEPYVKIVTQQVKPKSSTNQIVNDSYLTLRSVQAPNNQSLQQSRITPELMSLQQRMQILLQQIEEYCNETYSELGIRIESANTPPETYPADSLLPSDFGSKISMSPQLAWALAERRYEDARRMLDSALGITQSFVLYCLRGHLYKAMDSVEASIVDYSQALKLQESSELYMLRGTQYFTGGKRQEAYNDFANAVRLEPKNYQAVYMRGAAAYNLKRFEEACDDWSLAAQMGHPFADSVLEQRCASVMPKYVRTAIAEKKQQVKTALLLLEQIKENVQERRKISLNETSFTLDSLSYKSLGIACDVRYILEGHTSTFCMIHLLYTMTLELQDPIANDFVKKLQEKMQNFAASSSTHPSTSFDQTMHSIDYNKQIVDVVSNIKNIPNGIDKINSLQSLQTQQKSAMQNSAKNNVRNIPAQYPQVIISNLIDQMEKYIFVQYADILEK